MIRRPIGGIRMNTHSEDYWRKILSPDLARRTAGNWVGGDEIGYSHRIIQILGGPGSYTAVCENCQSGGSS